MQQQSKKKNQHAHSRVLLRCFTTYDLQICNVWLSDNKQAIRHHEQGKKHTEIVRNAAQKKKEDKWKGEQVSNLQSCIITLMLIKHCSSNMARSGQYCVCSIYALTCHQLRAATQPYSI
jgi:U1 zinc finger